MSEGNCGNTVSGITSIIQVFAEVHDTLFLLNRDVESWRELIMLCGKMNAAHDNW